MKINFSSFNHQFFNFSVFITVLLTAFCFNSFAQKQPKTRKVAFDTLASIREKTEIARPRLVEENKNEENKNEEGKPRNEEKNSDTATNTILVTSAVVIKQLEQKAFEILNERRKENGLSALQWSEDAAKIARLHSENMAKFKFFSHAGLDGTMVNDRADSLGFSRWKAIGENIAYNRGYDNPVEFACQRWMQSQSHRENMLNSRWKEAGVGVAITAEGTYYFTQVFILR